MPPPCRAVVTACECLRGGLSHDAGGSVRALRGGRSGLHAATICVHCWVCSGFRDHGKVEQVSEWQWCMFVVFVITVPVGLLIPAAARRPRRMRAPAPPIAAWFVVMACVTGTVRRMPTTALRTAHALCAATASVQCQRRSTLALRIAAPKPDAGMVCARPMAERTVSPALRTALGTRRQGMKPSVVAPSLGAVLMSAGRSLVAGAGGVRRVAWRERSHSQVLIRLFTGGTSIFCDFHLTADCCMPLID